jgi:hypothetical protein
MWIVMLRHRAPDFSWDATDWYYNEKWGYTLSPAFATQYETQKIAEDVAFALAVERPRYTGSFRVHYYGVSAEKAASYERSRPYFCEQPDKAEEFPMKHWLEPPDYKRRKKGS